MNRVMDGLLLQVEGTSAVARDDVLFGVLLAGLACSALLLLSMLTTSWGDRRAASKAFVLSLLVHVSCFAGLIVLMSRLEYVSLAELLQGGEEQTQILQAFPDAEPFHAAASSERPVWERVLPADSVPVERRRVDPLSLESVATPERNVAPEERTLASVADPTPLPDSSDPTPAAAPSETDPSEAPLLASNPPATVVPDAVVPESRAEAAASRGPSRQRVTLPGDTERPSAQPQPRRGDPGEVAIAAPGVSALPGANVASDVRAPDAPRAADAGNAGAVRGARVGPAPEPVPMLAESGGGVESSGDASRNPESSGTATAAQSLRTGTVRTSPGEATPRVERTRPSSGSRSPVTVATTRGAVGIGPVDDTRPAPTAQTVPSRAGAVTRDAGVPGRLGLRKLSQTPEVAFERGASQETLEAVEQSLVWLARNQEPDGRWDSSNHGGGRIRGDYDTPRGEQPVVGRTFGTGDVRDREYAGVEADAGVTGLALLTFLAHGHNHDDGKYSRTVEAGLGWLIARQEPNGYLGGLATRHARMYCHGMATYALAEAYAMQRDKTFDTRLRRPLERAVAYILDQQNPDDGGWRYDKGQVSDMSMFGWQLMALKSAYEALGVPMPDEPRRKMIGFLVDRSIGSKKGLAGYGVNEDVTIGTRPTLSMTAEALFCKQMLGIQRNDPQCLQALDYLSAQPPRRSNWNLYYWYYATLAMRSHGGDYWKEWNEALRDVLVAEQRTQGPHAGSWDPIGPWGPYGGRVYSTCLASLCLQVYWRYPSVAPRETPFGSR
ncbi:MAG: hypothetical protein WD066_07170 [Planctomycetaceae bacterium]